MLEGIVEQNQCLFMRLKCLHVVHAFLPRFHGQLRSNSCTRHVSASSWRPIFFKTGHHQQGVFMVGVLQQGCGHVLQRPSWFPFKSSSTPSPTWASRKCGSSSKHWW